MQSDTTWTIPVVIGWIIMWIGIVAVLFGGLGWFITYYPNVGQISRGDAILSYISETWPAPLAAGMALPLVSKQWTSIWTAVVALICALPAVLMIAMASFDIFTWVEALFR